jgi:hypothetical protein
LGGLKIPDQFFTFASFGTLSGCAVIAWLVTSVLCRVFKLSQGPTGLIVAIIVALVAVLLSPEKRFEKYVAAVFNGFLIYLTVVGGTSFTPYVNPRTPEDATKPALIKLWIPDKNLVIKSTQQEEALTKVESELNQIDRAIRQAPELPEAQKKLLQRDYIWAKSPFSM